jgi:hypothetical protein
MASSSYSTGSSSGAIASSPTANGSEIATRDSNQSRAAASIAGSDVHIPISRLDLELLVKITGTPVHGLRGTIHLTPR